MNNKYISREKLRQIPELPGIYKMLDSSGKIIYIGKSKSLRKRVQSYFTATPKWDKINKMVSLIKDIEYIVTDTHLEARLLECRLIKEYRPTFNSQMKNDRDYFFIKVNSYGRNASPLSISDNRTTDCFGPFRGRYAMQEFIDRLKSFYPIIKTENRYEFDYHLFPFQMDEVSFNSNRSVLLELFTNENNIDIITDAFQVKMDEAVIDFRYEAAAIYRDLIVKFKSIKKGLNGYKDLLNKNIVLKLPITNGRYKLFYVASGIIVNSLITDGLTQPSIDNFINESRLKASETAFSMTDDNSVADEKSWIDYRDILYSEILNLPEEMVELI